jgi:selenide,water dikinase
MKRLETPVLKDLVLLGGGHSHVSVLKRFGMKPLPGVRLTVICRDVHTPYSGMLPGLIAGHYGFDDTHIDLGPLCRFAGARLFRDEAAGLDLENKRVLCRGRPPVSYDLLSINVGSTPRLADVPGAAEAVVPVKPINRFLGYWEEMSRRVLAHDGPLRIGVVGAGAGGVELLLAVQFGLRRLLAAAGRDAERLSFVLITDSARILPSHNERTGRIFERVLAERRVEVLTGRAVVAAAPGRLTLAGGCEVALDEALWVTAAGAAPWLRESGLSVDEHGFVKVNETLQSVSHPDVFAAGDIAAMVDHPRPKSGVYAVRAGPPLEHNLRRALLGQPLTPFRPQRHALAIITTGDRHAVAARDGWALAGRVMWLWKDWIDRRFMKKFNEPPQMMEPAGPAVPPGLADTEAIREISTIAMRCGGCGAKVGGTVLARALAALRPVQRPDVLIGLDAPDDAAVVDVPTGKVMVHTVDYFRSFVDDPYVFGQIAANHSLGDIYAMGAEPQTALAIVTIPYGVEAKVEEQLSQLMAGALEILAEAGAALVGGHTGEGAELGLGFAVNGLADRDALLRKGGMKTGDRLILTKPIGTGALFAADMRGRAKGRWIQAALASMTQSNRAAAACLRRFGATACTDVTGFGLLGHLAEMTKPSGVDAEVDLGALPLLDGALETVQSGIFSSMQPQNLRLRRAIRNLAEAAADARFPLIFDPQTAGGLLASLPEAQADACLSELRRLGYAHAAAIGRALARSDAPEPITLCL